MQPGDLAASSASAGDLRDGLAATLNGIPCAPVSYTHLTLPTSDLV